MIFFFLILPVKPCMSQGKSQRIKAVHNCLPYYNNTLWSGYSSRTLKEKGHQGSKNLKIQNQNKQKHFSRKSAILSSLKYSCGTTVLAVMTQRLRQGNILKTRLVCLKACLVVGWVFLLWIFFHQDWLVLKKWPSSPFRLRIRHQVVLSHEL